jgi:tartrate-resistant acid phosphatase type 5
MAQQQSRGLRFLVMGDWGGSASTDPQAKLAEQMGSVGDKLGVSFVLALGDNFYRHGVSSVDDSRFKTSYEDIYTQSSLQVPWYLVAGNRDHKGNVNAQIEYTKVSPRWRFPSLYYTVVTTLPGSSVTVQFIFLDTMLYLGPNSGQQDLWLEDTLQKSTADWLFVCGHHPVYSAGRHGPTARLVNQLRPLLEKYRVAAYMCGHDHNLQHIQDGSSVDYFVSGAGYETCDDRKHQTSLPQNASKYFWPPQATPFGGFMSAEVLDQRSLVVAFHDSEGHVLYTCRKTNPRLVPGEKHTARR